MNDQEYQFFTVEERGGTLFVFQKERNTIAEGQQLEPSDFRMCTTEHGILVNGDYGINPSAAETQEFMDIVRRMIAFLDQQAVEQP